MCRNWIAGTGLLLSILATSGFAEAGDTQRVEGTVLMATAGNDGLVNQVALMLATRFGVNGVTHYFFEIERGTKGTAFALTSPSPMADLDIVFASHGGTRRFATRGTSETGRVPSWAARAEIIAYSGANVSFAYVAG